MIGSNNTAADSLPEVNATVALPTTPSVWRRIFAFAGPAYMVSVGYMDPGNWATDIVGGSRFAYDLVWVLLLSNLMAVLLQTLSARLGIVTGRDLAQACREYYGRRTALALWGICEVAIGACDLAEVLGTAIGLNLLFGISILTGVILTALDVFVLLLMQRFGIRKMEGFILALIFTIGACYVFEIAVAKPDWHGVLLGFRPRIANGAALFAAVSIIGATVMPHNLYLHSALVQTRQVARTPEGMRQANRYNFIDSAIALNLAFFVNAAILVLSAAAFFPRETELEIQDAHALLTPLLGPLAGTAFAVGLICAGQSSTLTGTLAGQVVMEGFIHFRMRPWLRRLLTRSLAIVPAVVVIAVRGDGATTDLLVLSQVVLSLQLPFAVVPLIQFTGDRKLMGEFASGWILKTVAWAAALIILGLDLWLVGDTLRQWYAYYPRIVIALATTVVPALAVFLAYVVTHPLRVRARPEPALPPVGAGRAYRHIGIALAADESDRAVLEHGLSVAKTYGADVLLVHVAEGFGPRFFGRESTDEETRDDARYLERARADAEKAGVRAEVRLLYGDPTAQIAKLVEDEKFDLLVMGSHGHRVFGDVLFGSTVSPVRHRVHVPMLVVREEPSA